ncbi:MAG TPA: CoA transferase [Pseudonocardiaceae bacterium]|nr:CoA transferase [Pseudonocardiaceae bacterium]
MTERLRVVEYADDCIAASFAACLLGSLGADVVKIETTPDPLRHRPPLVDGESLPFRYTARHKHWVTDLSRDLIESADVLITSGEPPCRARGATIVITPFGLTGPWASWSADALGVFHAGGVGYVTPRSAQTGSAGEIPPQAPAGYLAEYFCGMYAALLALAGFDSGVLIDLSMQDCLLPLTRREVGAWLANGQVASRSGRLWQVGPSDFYPAADGWVYVSVIEDAQWRRLLTLCGVVGKPPEHLATAKARFDHPDDVEALIGGWLRSHTRAEIFELTGAGGVPVGPAFSPADLVAQGLGAELPESDFVPAASTEPRLPLRGLRIIEFTHVWAGPLCGQFLADLGAEVIKVESRRYLDVHRRAGPYVDGVADLDGSTVFRAQNRGKLSVTLDLKSEQGRDLALRLIATADAVVENFRPGTLARLGLDLAAMRAVRPNIVLLSLSGYGQHGARRDFPAYGPMMDAVTGLSWLTRDGAGRPQSVNGWFPDVAGALYGAVSAVAAIRAGTSTHVDVSELDSLLSFLPEQFDTGAEDWRYANQGPGGRRCLPLRCQGEDTWIAVSFAEPDRGTTLAGVEQVAAALLGVKSGPLPELLAQLAPTELCTALQSAGLSAVPVLSARNLIDNEHLAARGSFLRADEPSAATTMYAPAWLVDGVRGGTGRPAPGLGEHTEQVLSDLLGLSVPEIDRLRTEHVLH